MVFMKIESSLSSRSLLLIQGCLLSFISLLFIKSAVSSLVFVGIVAFGFLLILIYHFPNLVLPIFLTSLFWGEIYFRKGDFGVTISDPFFVLLTAGYLCVAKAKKAMFKLQNQTEELCLLYSIWFKRYCRSCKSSVLTLILLF